MGAAPLAGDSPDSGVDSPAGEAASIPLEREPGCSATARRFVTERLSGRSSEVALENAMLVASELVTNAFQHGQGTIELCLRTRAGRVRIEVVDEGGGVVPKLREPGAMLRGWGLQIVEQLSDNWGSFDDAARVWAELPLG